jgi:hypothetical protein
MKINKYCVKTLFYQKNCVIPENYNLLFSLFSILLIFIQDQPKEAANK